MIEKIIYRGKEFAFSKQINNDYDFEIACETLANNVHNNIHRCTRR